MKKEEMLEALGGLPDDMVLHAEIKSETEQAGDTPSARAARREKRREKWALLTTDGRFVAAVSLLAAFGVLFAVIWAGRIQPNRPVPKPANGQTSAAVLSPTKEDKSLEAEAPANTAAERLGLKTYHGMKANETVRLTFTSNGDGTCALTDIDVNLLYEKPFTLVIPDKSPDGDTVTAVDTHDTYGLSGLPLYLSEEDGHGMFAVLAENIGESDYYYKKLLAYYGGENGVRKLENQPDEEKRQAMLDAFPITAAVGLWVYDPSANVYERMWAARMLHLNAPEIDMVTRYEYLLHLQTAADAAGGLRMPMQPDEFRADGRYIRAIVLPETVERINVGAFGTCFGLTELRTDMTVKQLESVKLTDLYVEWVANPDGSISSRTVLQEYGFLEHLTGMDRYATLPAGVRAVCADGSFLIPDAGDMTGNLPEIP